MNEPRPYRDERDLEAMRSLLMAGRKAGNGTYYIHTGDLNWWLYYPPLEGDFWDQIYLWDDSMQAGQLSGWVLFSPDWVGIDVYIQPELRGSDTATAMYVWAEERATRIARNNGKPTIYVVWIQHDDDVLCDHFVKRGYKLRRGYVHLRRSLEDAIKPAHVPDGFTVRSCKGEPEVGARANAQYGSFGSTVPFERYLERFKNFMRSPVYDHDMDIVAVSPEGEIGAFCIVWMDPVNRVGHFEPVGTHPDYQRQGLGRVVMQEGLRRLQRAGMKSADVLTFEDNLTAIKFYESEGFRIVNQLGTFEKDV